ncbi:hypothetical protein MEQU1_000694 [Malassezia equina]|uniref:N-acetyltransferase domain-containing protein n=1 Tax=Malassezia equina TaxID=1381935 RepID=A0AAF0E950_9BASI|nr:hypothetical protein MEQU1_000694 [Malassezia equina]
MAPVPRRRGEVEASEIGPFPLFAIDDPRHDDGTIMGYVLGKAEGREPSTDKRKRREEPTLHGHVTAVTVAPEYRRLGVAQMLMDFFELISEHVYHGFFVDLFVRPSNEKAIGMYEKRGYSVYRRVHGYYQSGSFRSAEDGFAKLSLSP